MTTAIDHNVETGEVLERELTKAEIEQTRKDNVENQKMRKAEKDRQLARESALGKLAQLGLTEAEIQALTA